MLPKVSGHPARAGAWLSAHFVIMTMGIFAQLPDASRTFAARGLALAFLLVEGPLINDGRRIRPNRPPRSGIPFAPVVLLPSFTGGGLMPLGLVGPTAPLSSGYLRRFAGRAVVAAPMRQNPQPVARNDDGHLPLVGVVLGMDDRVDLLAGLDSNPWDRQASGKG